MEHLISYVKDKRYKRRIDNQGTGCQCDCLLTSFGRLGRSAHTMFVQPVREAYWRSGIKFLPNRKQQFNRQTYNDGNRFEDRRVETFQEQE